MTYRRTRARAQRRGDSTSIERAVALFSPQPSDRRQVGVTLHRRNSSTRPNTNRKRIRVLLAEQLCPKGNVSLHEESPPSMENLFLVVENEGLRGIQGVEWQLR